MTAHERSEDHKVGSPRTRDYAITVQGHLTPRWSSWLDGLDLILTDRGTTVITGPIVDQAALHGLLQKLRDLGIPLISLTPTSPDDGTPNQKGPDMITRFAPPDIANSRPPMTPARKAALVAGIAYIATFVFSIPVKFGLWKDAIDKPDFILGAGSDGGIRLGAIFEVLTGLGGVVSAVALYAVAKRYSIRSALGFVTTRVMESVVIFVGVLAMLTMYTLRNNPVGSADSMSTVGRALLAIHDWTFLLGPGLMPALNALCIGTVMYKSRLLPRWIPTVGLIGAPMLIISSTAVLYGAWDQLDPIAGLWALPIAVWEFSFGVYMTVKGFRSVPEAVE